MPAKDYKPEVYDPVVTADEMVLDELDAGLLWNHADGEAVHAVVMSFVTAFLPFG